MKKKLMSKLFVTQLVCFSCFTLLIPCSIKATNIDESSIQFSSSELKDIIDSNEKIMEYDAKTNTVTEVDMEQLRENLTSKVQKNTNPIFTSPNNLIQPYANPLPTLSVQRVTNTSVFPHKQVCRIYCNTASGGSGIGTASVVGPNVALTAAHCVFDPETNQPYPNWGIKAGYTTSVSDPTNITYYGTPTGWSKVYYSNLWMQEHKNRYDWAVCVLGDNIGNEIGGWLETAVYSSDSSLNGTNIRAIGYPSDTNYGFPEYGSYQYQTGSDIFNVAENYFWFHGWGVRGFSGGPVVRTSDYRIVGINVAMHATNRGQSLAVRITPTIADLINSLK